MSRFWERVMLALVVCIPVPALALSGLNIPLPSVVERVAAALVPFASATMGDGATLASGAIVHAPGYEAQTTPSRRPRTATAKVVQVVRSVEKAPTARVPRQVGIVSGSLEPAKPGPTPTGDEEPTSDVPESPAPAPDAPTPTVPPTSDEPTPGEPDVTPPVEPDAKPEPNDETDVTPTVQPDVKPDEKPDEKPADETKGPPRVPLRDPDVTPSDPPGTDTGDERRAENAVASADSASGK